MAAVATATRRGDAPDDGRELVLRPAGVLLKVLLWPVWLVAAVAAWPVRWLSHGWTVPAALAVFSGLLAWRRYGGPLPGQALPADRAAQEALGRAVLLDALSDYLAGWAGVWLWLYRWLRQTYATLGLVPEGRIGEALGRFVAGAALTDDTLPIGPATLLTATAGYVWPVALPAGLVLAAWWTRHRPRRAAPLAALDDAGATDDGAGIVAEDGAWRPTAAARFRHWRSTRRPVTHPRGRALLGYLAASPVGRAVRLPLGALCRHVFLIGATGFGKTTLLLHLVDAALREGWAVFLIDCKGDPDLLAYAGERGGEVYALDGRRKWDALTGNRTQVADRLIAGEMAHSDARYYPEIMGRYVQTVLGVLDAAHGDGSPVARDPHEVGRLLAPKALKAEVARLVATGAHDGLRPLLATIDADYVGDQHTEAALLGFRHRYNRLLEGVIGPTLGPGVGPDGKPALDLERAVRAGKLVLFSVPTDAYQGQGKKVAMWAILAAQALTAELRADDYARTGGRLLFVIDEFAQLEEETTRMGPLLRMARSAGVGVILAAQGTVDLFAKVDARTATATLATILNACSTKIVMRQGDHEDREPWVEHFGEREVETRTASYDAVGEVTGQRVVTKKRPVVSGEELGKLGIGQAIVQTDAGLLRVLVPARLPVAALQTGTAEAPAPAVVIKPPVAGAPPMSPDPDADVVIDVEARTVEASMDESVATLPDESPRASADERTHGAPAPRRGSRFFE